MRNPPAAPSRQSQLRRDDLDALESGIESITSLYSAALFREIAEARFSEGRRHGFVATLLMLEVDNFDGIRRQHGRLVADAAMLSVMELLSVILRREDMVALRGDATFEILLMHCDGVSAHMKAESLRSAVASLDPAGVAITASIGVAYAAAASGLQFGPLSVRVATALQTARTRGGDCVVFGAAPEVATSGSVTPTH